MGASIAAHLNERTHLTIGMLERRRQFMAAHRRDARRPDEHPGPRGPLRPRNAETLVCELDDDGVRRLRDRAHPLGPGRIQNGLRVPGPYLRGYQRLLRELHRDARGVPTY